MLTAKGLLWYSRKHALAVPLLAITSASCALNQHARPAAPNYIWGWLGMNTQSSISEGFRVLRQQELRVGFVDRFGDGHTMQFGCLRQRRFTRWIDPANLHGDELAQAIISARYRARVAAT